jgi:hypothetical protein
MNERIQELAEQAHSYACKYAQQPDYNPHNPYNQGMYKQRYDSKFAESIVKECITTMTNLESDIKQKFPWKKEEVVSTSGHIQKLKEHFGVEE